MKKIIQLSALLIATFSFGQTPLHRFNFENNLQNTASTVTLTNNNATYVAGRNAAAGQAININNTVTANQFVSGTIAGLPNGALGWSMSFWLKMNTNEMPSHFFFVGTNNLAIPFNGFTFRRLTGNLMQTFNMTNLMASFSNVYDANWHLYTITYDPSGGAGNRTIKIYRDDLLVSTTITNIEILGNNFSIGRNGDNVNAGNFSMDEFQIFQFPLSQSQVENIFYGTPAAIIAPSVVLNPITNIGLNTATVNFTMNQNNGATTTSVQWGSPSTGSSTMSGPNSHGNGHVLSQVLTNLIPGNQYQYRIISNNSASSTVVTDWAFFTTRAAANMVYHFEFNGTYASSVNTGTLNCTTLPGFTGNGTSANSAANINVPNANGRDANTLTANLPLLPNGMTARSYACRVLVNGTTFPADNQYVYSSGSGANNNSFDFWINANSVTVGGWGAGNDKVFTTTNATNTWYNFAIVYDGVLVAVYKDGVQLGAAQSITSNTPGTTLNIGRSAASNFGQASIRLDDLKVFTGMLDQAQITQLAASTAALSNNDFASKNLKFKMFPNPASNILNIDLASELQSVEIYSLQGQKVMSATDKQINIANLSSGMYMVRVQDVDGGVATQKLVKEAP